MPVTLLQTNACSPLATNAHRRQHLGQLLVADVQGPAVGRHDHGARSVHRRAAAVRDAGRRARLHASAVADQRLVDGAVPAQQHASGRSTPSPSVEARMRVVRGVDRADAVAGEARAGHGARRQGAGRDRSHHRAQLRHASRPATCRRCLRPLHGPAAPTAAAAVRAKAATSRSARSRRRAGQPARQHGAAVRDATDLGAACRARCSRSSSCWCKLKRDLPTAAGRTRRDEQVRKRFANLGEPMLELSKCPDFVVNRGHYFGTAIQRRMTEPREARHGCSATTTSAR